MSRRRLWMVVLAGGEGRRLRPLIEQIHGDARPKQFAGPFEGRSMLDQTLERMRPLVPAERTIVVTVEAQRHFLPAALTHHPGVQAFVQPADRGTAAAILWPSVQIAAGDPGAQVLVVPSDHYVGDEAGLRQQLAAAAEWHGARPVLFGVAPESAVSDYGWIELERDGHDPVPLFGIRGFVEKPDRATADRCFARGDLWNTLIVLADATALIDVMAMARPDLVAPFGRVYSSPAARLVEAAYAAIPPADFSSEVLAKVPRVLSAWQLPPLRWSDLGTVDRVLDRLRLEGYQPWWRTVSPVEFDQTDRADQPRRTAVARGPNLVRS